MLIVMGGVVFLLKLFGEKKAPALFSQARVGLYNKEFTLYKFRSMFMNAESNGAQWASKKDPRITQIGRFLRLTRLYRAI
jgi:lipopolysaccharide/colanic/teichoic acid biosynthesis glycosyltransferase